MQPLATVLRYTAKPGWRAAHPARRAAVRRAGQGAAGHRPGRPGNRSARMAGLQVREHAVRALAPRPAARAGAGWRRRARSAWAGAGARDQALVQRPHGSATGASWLSMSRPSPRRGSAWWPARWDFGDGLHRKGVLVAWALAQVVRAEDRVVHVQQQAAAGAPRQPRPGNRSSTSRAPDAGNAWGSRWRWGGPGRPAWRDVGRDARQRPVRAREGSRSGQDSARARPTRPVLGHQRGARCAAPAPGAADAASGGASAASESDTPCSDTGWRADGFEPGQARAAVGKVVLGVHLPPQAAGGAVQGLVVVLGLEAQACGEKVGMVRSYRGSA